LVSRQKIEYADHIGGIEKLILDLASDEGLSVPDGRSAAVAFTALLDGLWLTWRLNPDAFSPAEGVETCRKWFDGLRRGLYA